MQITRLFVLCSLSFALVLASVYPLSARAPKTEKIAFSSKRKGNWEIYIMNPDGSQQERLTRNGAGTTVRFGLRQVSKFSSLPSGMGTGISM